MYRVDPTKELSLKMYTQPYSWSEDYEVDITQDIKDGMTLQMELGASYSLSVTVRNDRFRFIDTDSQYHMFRGQKFKLKFNDKEYKFTLVEPPYSIAENELTLSLSGPSYELAQSIAQIRVKPSTDGVYYLEDILWSALYDTGLQNWFVIDTDSGYYHPSTSNMYKRPIDNDVDVVYDKVTVLEILNDLCERNGYSWYISCPTSIDQSVIHIVDILSNMEVPQSDIVYIRTRHDASEIGVERSIDSISNIVYFDKLPIILSDEDSIDEYGKRNPTRISISEENTDVDLIVNYAQKYLDISKDPDTTITVSCHGIADIESVNKYIKLVGEDNKYDNTYGIDKKYRIISISYDFSSSITTIVCGNKYKSILAEKIMELIAGNSNISDTNDAMEIAKKVDVRIQVNTVGANIDEPSVTTTHGVRVGIDYLYDSTYSPNSKIYFEDDGVRNGN